MRDTSAQEKFGEAGRAYAAFRGGLRFAPSPTGTFHLGNLRSAWISQKLAERASLSWILRFEDIDQARVVPGALEKQLIDLQILGLVPHSIYVQSDFLPTHRELFRRLASAGGVYPCICSRKEVQASLSVMASAPHGPQPLYDGHCRHTPARKSDARAEVAWRWCDPDDDSGTRDFIVGRSPTAAVENLSLLETDFQPSYHWSCAVDDLLAEHRVIVRAWDLFEATDLQRKLQVSVCTLLGVEARPPAVFHCSLITQDDGHRLEKRSQGVTLAELLNIENVDQILAKFQASAPPELEISFAPGAISSGRIFGEEKKQLTLSQLGFKSSP